MKTGIDFITEERKRQIEVEGWSPENDDRHENNEMPNAAAIYCLGKTLRDVPSKRKVLPVLHFWPWDPKWLKWSPNNRIKELSKAGALIAAEIDRLQRSKNSL